MSAVFLLVLALMLFEGATGRPLRESSGITNADGIFLVLLAAVNDVFRAVFWLRKVTK